MPRRPSKTDLKKYDVEAFIQQKVNLITLCEADLDTLRDDPEGSEKARRELYKNNECFEGHLPETPEDSQAFLRKCERLVEQPASTLVDRHRRSGVAVTLVTHMISLEATFPDNVRFYILGEYSRRLDEMMPDPSDDEIELMPYDYWPKHVQRRIISKACKSVDEDEADKLLDDPDLSIEDYTFILPGDCPDDTLTIHVLGDERSAANPFWDVFYGDSCTPVKLNNKELRDLLVDSIAWKDKI